MNIWQYSLKIASLCAVATVSLACVSAIAQGCPGKKAQFLESSPLSSTGNGSGTTAARPGFDDNETDSSGLLKSDRSATGEAWKLVAILLATTGLGSTVFLVYKAWASRKLTPTTPVTHPKLEHPELQLTDLPKEALPNMAYADLRVRDWQREVVLTR